MPLCLLKRAAAAALVMLTAVPSGSAQPARSPGPVRLAQSDPVASAVQKAAERAAARSMRSERRAEGVNNRAAGPGGDRRTLTADGLGPLAAGSRYGDTFGWVGNRFPPEATTVDVGGAMLPALAFTNKEGRIVVQAAFASEDGPLQWIRILAGTFGNAEGHEMREPFSEVFPGGDPGTCGPGEGWMSGTVLCWEPNEPSLGLVFARPKNPFASGTMPPARQLERLKVRELVWRAGTEPATRPRDTPGGTMDGGTPAKSGAAATGNAGSAADTPRRRRAHGSGADSASAAGAAGASRAATEDAGGPSLGAVRSTELLRTSTDVLGKPLLLPRESLVTLEVTANMVELDPGASTPWHKHVVPMLVSILEGEIEVSYRSGGGIETRVYREGDTFMEADGVPHRGHVPAGGEPVRMLQVFLGAPDLEPTVAAGN